MKLARQRCIYCSPEKWELIRRRARKARMPLSRFGVLCCIRAGENRAVSSPEPTGHPLVLSEHQQRRLHEDAATLSRSGGIVIQGRGGAKAMVLPHEAVRFLRLSEAGDGP